MALDCRLLLVACEQQDTGVFIGYTVFCGNTDRAAEKSRVGPESLIIESGWPGEGLLP